MAARRAWPVLCARSARPGAAGRDPPSAARWTHPRQRPARRPDETLPPPGGCHAFGVPRQGPASSTGAKPPGRAASALQREPRARQFRTGYAWRLQGEPPRGDATARRSRPRRVRLRPSFRADLRPLRFDRANASPALSVCSREHRRQPAAIESWRLAATCSSISWLRVWLAHLASQTKMLWWRCIRKWGSRWRVISRSRLLIASRQSPRDSQASWRRL